MVDILKIITMCDGVVSELGRWRIVPARNRKFADLYGSFSVKWFVGLCRFLVWSGKAVPRPVACDQVGGARGKVSRDRNASAA